jgi:hypothetical protein
MRFRLLLILSCIAIVAKAERVDAIVEQSHTTIKVFSEKKILKIVNRKIQIISERGDEHSQLIFSEDDFKEMREYTVRIFNSAGQLAHTYYKRNFEEGMDWTGLNYYDDTRIFYLDASLSGYPYTIEYTYTMVMDYIFDFSWSASNSEYTLTLDRDLTFSYPESMEVILYFDSTQVKHMKTVEDEMVIHSFRADSIESIAYEPYSPPNEKGRVDAVFKTFNYNGYKGSFESWDTYGQWMNALWEDRDQLSRNAFETVYPNGFEHLSPRERAVVAYDYIQENMRYVAIGYGMGGLQTMEANDTFKKGYGDCKALTNFMHSVLAYANVESFPAFVSAGSNSVKIYPDRPIHSFNHVILCIPMGADTLWSECTSNRLPFNYLSDHTDDRYVMLKTPSGGKLTRTPEYSELENVRVRNIRVDISASGSADLRFEGTYNNLAIDRSAFYIKETAGLTDERVMTSATRMKSLDVEKIEVNLYPEDEPIMKVSVAASDRVFAKRMGTKMLIKPFLFKDDFPVFEDDKRENPIYFKRGFTSIDTMVIHFPEGLHLNEPMDFVIFNSDYGEFELTASENDLKNELTIIRKLSYPAGLYPKSDYDKIKSFFDAMRRTETLSLVLVP